MTLRVRPMTAADVGPAADVVRRGTWGERQPFFEFAVRHRACRPMVADLDGEVVGSGVGTANGRVGWVGMIFVDEARRRAGIGRAVTEAVVEDLRGRGCDTIVLVATAMGRPVYERLGFEIEDSYVGFSIEAPALTDDAERAGPRLVRQVDAAPAPIRPLAPGDLDALLELDEWATGEDRGHLLRDVLRASAESRGFLVPDPGEPGTAAGYTLASGWGGWPAIARTVAAGLALLEHRRRATPGLAVRTAVLESNTEAVDALRAAGWQQGWSGVRMRLGPAFEWHPEAVWGQFNFGLG